MTTSYIRYPQASGGGGSGTVTSVGLAAPNIFTISGSPVTTSGTLTLTLANESANTVFAGPTSGGAAPPTFRTLVTGDIPSLSSIYVTTASLGTVTEATSSILTLSGWANATVGSPTIQVKLAATAQSGYLSSTDWNIFNGKQAAGNYLTALTGDGTASGPGSAALTLATVNSNVGSFGGATTSGTFTVNAKGLITAASSTSIQIAESQVTNLTTDLAAKQTTTLTNGNILVGNGSNVATSVSVTGDITLTNAGVTAIGTNKVANSQLAQMTAHTVKGNNTGSTANASDLTLGTVTEATSSILTLSSWANATVGSPTIQVKQSSGSQSGYLSSTDWTTFNSKFGGTIVVKNASYTILNNDNISTILGVTSSAPIIQTLPLAASNAARIIIIQANTIGGGTANYVDVVPNVADSVNGNVNGVRLYTTGESVTLQSDGANYWAIIAQNVSTNIVATNSSGTSLTTGTAVAVTSISVLKGTWQLNAAGIFTTGGALTGTLSVAAIGTTSASFSGTAGADGTQWQGPVSNTAVNDQSYWVSPVNTTTLTGATTYYLNARQTFTVGSSTVEGSIRAQRISLI